MLSFIIPARDEEKKLADTVAQFKKLSIPHEIIISDDGSTDRTVEIARSLGCKVVTYSGSVHAIGRARNAGVSIASGDILVFIDADSFFIDPQSFFSHAVSRLQSDPSLLALACPQLVRRDAKKFGDDLVFKLDNFFNLVQNNFLQHGAGSGKCIIARKEIFDRVKGFREDLIFREDCDFLKRISYLGKTRFDTKLTVYHSGRRLHRLGIFGFYWSWIINGLYVVFLDRARDKEWKPVR